MITTKKMKHDTKNSGIINSDSKAVASKPERQYGALKTAAVYGAYFTMGCSVAIVGPSLPSMEVILGVDTKTISWALTGRALGMLLGTISSGFVYSRISKELLFTILQFMLGTLVAICPLSTAFLYFMSMLTFQGYMIGFFDAAGQCYMLEIWKSHKIQASLFQAMYTAWSIGTVVSPFVLTPFLVDLNQHNTTDLFMNRTMSGDTSMNETWTQDIKDEAKEIKYGYIITGTVALISITLFLVYQAKTGCRFRPLSTEYSHSDTGNVRKKVRNKRVYVIYLTLVVIALFIYAFTNGLTFSYIASYAVKGLGWPNKEGGLVTSAFFVGHVFMKLVCIYALTRVSARFVLYVDVIGGALAYGLMLLSFVHVGILWLSAVLAGLFMATTQACIFLWAKSFVTVSGKISSLFMASCAIGEIVLPVVAGYIFDRFGLQSFPYLVFAASASLLVCVVVADLYSKRNFKLIISKIDEIDIDAEDEKCLGNVTNDVIQ